MRYLDILGITSICKLGFAIRLLTLSIVLTFSSHLSKGLLGSDIYNQDDLRYAEAAKMYASTAKGIIDYSALETALDKLETYGTHDHGIELWYWLVSICMFIFGNEFLIRILNIVFSIISIKCIYDICNILYTKKIAKLAALLYAVLPYPAFFCCFLYKDQFYSMLVLLLFRKAFQCAGHVKSSDIIYLVVGLLLAHLTRSGLSVILLSAVLAIIYKQGGYKIGMGKLVFVVTLFVAAIGYSVYLSWESIDRKVYYFFIRETEVSTSTISYFEIKSLYEVYKYPFTLLFAIIQPLNMRLTLKTWFDMVGLVNIVFIPVALGNILYLINIKIRKNYFFWVIQGLWLLVILTSLGITRHQYFLQPFIMMFFAHYYYQYKRKTELKVLSSVAIVAVLSLWIILGLKM